MTETTYEENINDIFELKPAREWLRGAKSVSRLPLLGELWAQGEIAVVFGKTGAGKSIFAVQLAEALARGRRVEPFDNFSAQQRVAYVDLERPAAQFIKRYSPEMDPETRKVTGQPYKFSQNLIRVEPRDDGRMEPEQLGGLIAATEAKILIIDSLSYFLNYTVPREATAVMRELRRLRNRFGISILATMNATRGAAKRTLTTADLPCSAVIAAAADSVFAIGSCVSRSNGRYIKHLKAGSRETSLGAGHIAYFVSAQKAGNFPALEFAGYTTEDAVIAEDNGIWERRVLNDIRRLRGEGLTIREIAAETGMSRSAVHRRLKIAEAVSTCQNHVSMAENSVSTVQNGVSITGNDVSIIENGVTIKRFYTFEACVVKRCSGCGTCGGRAGHNRFGTRGNIHGHQDCPDDCDICGPIRYPGVVEPELEELKRRSDEFYERLRDWLLDGKKNERPKYEGQRRYGVEQTGWYPGSENWTEEQVHIFSRWLRTKWETNEPQPEFSL